MKKNKFQEKGQALIVIALAAVVLFGFSALAIDGSRVFSDRRNAQNAADTAVMAAALAKVRGTDYTAAAITRATSNKYTNGANGATVTVSLCSDSGVTCVGLPAGATQSEYIRVQITSNVPMTFARILGWSTIPNKVEAIAHAVVPSGSSAGGPMFNGAAMVSTKSGNNNQCFLLNGSAMLYTHNSGIFINCSGTQALFMNGGAHLDMDAAGQIVGCYGYNGGAVYDPITCNVAPQTLNAAYFAGVPTTQAPPTCSSNGSVTGTGASASGTPPNVTINSGSTGTLSPGNFGSITINGSGATAIFSPGTYCVSGSFNLNGNSNMTGPSGTVKFVLLDQNIVMNGGSVVNFNDLEIYGRNASFLLNGSASFTATRLRLFLTGTGTFTVNGGSTLSSSNAYIYLAGGSLVWNGSSILNLHAPPQGDPFGGLLIHMPWGNTTATTLNGGSQINLTGTFMAPQSAVTYNGSVNFQLHSQIIASTFLVNGGAQVDIYYTASENYQPPSTSSPSIELTK